MTGGTVAARGMEGRGFTPWFIAYALSVLLYAWILGNLPLMAIPEAAHDDALFVRQAMSLLRGDWLGPYNNLTLAKGPFYPMWIAVSWLIGWPLLVSQGVLYAIGCLLLVRGLRPWLRWESAAFALFLFLLFNPALYGLGQLRVMREGIYVPQTVLIAACVAWWFRLRCGGMLARIGLAAAMGLLLASFWATREEGIWILPALTVAMVSLLIVEAREDPPSTWTMTWRERARVQGRRVAIHVGLAIVTLAATLGGLGLIGQMNQRWYGVTDIVEFKQKAFVSAYGALSRVRHEHGERPYVVIPREVLERLYPLSPAAAELRPYFDGSGPDGFANVGCAVYGVNPCDREVRAGWFMWALREAVAQAGHYRTAVEAREFYGRLAREIDDACGDGRLDCLPPRATMAPPFRWSQVEPTLRTAVTMLGFMAGMDSMTVPRAPMSCLIDDCGQGPNHPWFLGMTHSTLFVHAPWLGESDFRRRSGPGGEWFFQKRSDMTARGLEAITSIYRTVLPWLLGAAVAAYLALGVQAVVTRVVAPLFLAATFCAAIVGARVGLLAYLDVVAIPSMNSLYLSPAYPALLLFAATALLGGVWAVLDAVKERRDPPSSTGSLVVD